MECTSNTRWLARGAAALVLVAVTSAATASVVKCIAADGTVTYQNTTCAHGAKGQPVDTTPNSGGRFATEREIRDAKRRAAVEDRPPPAAVRPVKRKAAAHAFNADERRFIQAGMSEAEVRRRIGAPDSTVRRSSNSGKSSSRPKDSTLQWVYYPAGDDSQTTTTLTFKGGSVIHIDRKVTR
ncbi:MAG: DUF4124 domain-containing protein [Betaproteobacteria bacterium]